MQNLQLSIPEPCHENWQQMTPTDQGRFCNACAKEVIDFSTMTDIQVLNYFTNMTNEKVCGRALPEQLDRTLSRHEQPKKKLFWYWNYMVMFFMFFGKGNSAKAQGGIKPITELSPVKNTDIRGELIKVGDVNRVVSRVITGKIMDIDGNPVSFASVKIKGTSKGVAADANGAYSMRINLNDILVISGAGFTETEVPSGKQSVFNTVLNKSSAGEIVVVASHCFGGVKRKLRGETNIFKTSAVNTKIIFQVKEENTGLPIGNAAIIISRKGDNLSNKILSDNKGIYKFTEIKINESYFIKVEAAGFEPNEFTIDAKDFNDREKPWEVLLRKQKITNKEKGDVSINDSRAGKVTGLQVKSNSNGKIGNQNIIRLGGVHVQNVNKEILYVVDGNIMLSSSADIDPDDVDNITILQASEAVALFGPDGANGAIVIITRKAKEIKMKEVVVTSDFENRRMGGMTGGITITNQGSHLNEIITTVKTILTDSIKVYPNPVQRNTAFSVVVKLKHAGNYIMQVTDASGRIFLQQKFNANSKDHSEKIMGDSRWAAGVYYIRVFDNKNQLINKTSFIFE